jgi:hypothetical protein
MKTAAAFEFCGVNAPANSRTPIITDKIFFIVFSYFEL